MSGWMERHIISKKAHFSDLRFPVLFGFCSGEKSRKLKIKDSKVGERE